VRRRELTKFQIGRFMAETSLRARAVRHQVPAAGLVARDWVPVGRRQARAVGLVPVGEFRVLAAEPAPIAGRRVSVAGRVLAGQRGPVAGRVPAQELAPVAGRVPAEARQPPVAGRVVALRVLVAQLSQTPAAGLEPIR
jgi:hypothetical protein